MTHMHMHLSDRRSRFFGTFAVRLGACAWLAVGCGSVSPATGDAGGNDGGASDTAPDVVVTVSQACDQQAAAICNALDTCAAFMVRVLYGDKATCLSRLALGCTGDQDVPGTTRTIADIGACSQAVTAASCPDLLAGRFPDVCLVKPGTRVDGSTCGSDWQCASTYCRKTDQCGTCGPKSAAGGACTVDGGCQTGMVCAPNGRCVMPGNESAACNPNQPCRSDLYCTAAMAGVCAAKVGAAGPCADSDKACDLVKGVACNPFNKTCENVSVANGGNACGIVNAGLTVCVGLNPCVGLGLLQFTGVCANPAADGAACGAAANSINCVGPASCQAGICRLPSAQTCG